MSASGRPGLRPRWRTAVRLEVAAVAWTLFAERGFDEVTVDEVAAAAGISRATFFRYFRTKDEAVLAALDELGAKSSAALAQRPTGEDAWLALRRCLDVAIAPSHEAPERSLARARLIQTTPALRMRELERYQRWQALLTRTLTARLGVDGGELAAEALVGAALSATELAARRWTQSNGALELADLVDEAFTAVRAPARRLR